MLMLDVRLFVLVLTSVPVGLTGLDEDGRRIGVVVRCVGVVSSHHGEEEAKAGLNKKIRSEKCSVRARHVRWCMGPRCASSMKLSKWSNAMATSSGSRAVVVESHRRCSTRDESDSLFLAHRLCEFRRAD